MTVTQIVPNQTHVMRRSPSVLLVIVFRIARAVLQGVHLMVVEGRVLQIVPLPMNVIRQQAYVVRLIVVG